MNQQFVLLLLLFPTLTSSLSQAGSGLDLNPASSLQREFEHLKTNSQLRHPDPTPTVFTEEEINAISLPANSSSPPESNPSFSRQARESLPQPCEWTLTSWRMSASPPIPCYRSLPGRMRWWGGLMRTVPMARAWSTSTPYG